MSGTAIVRVTIGQHDTVQAAEAAIRRGVDQGLIRAGEVVGYTNDGHAAEGDLDISVRDLLAPPPSVTELQAEIARLRAELQASLAGRVSS